MNRSRRRKQAESANTPETVDTIVLAVELVVLFAVLFANWQGLIDHSSWVGWGSALFGLLLIIAALLQPPTASDSDNKRRSIVLMKHWPLALAGLYAGAPLSGIGVVADVLFFGLAFVLATLLISQFVLPVATQNERKKAVDSFWRYISGSHGPIIFVRNGDPVLSESDKKRKGKGVILADSASAAVLENKGKFSRAIGPGITFTDENEKLLQALDLRKQVRTVEAQGLTADGIVVNAEVTVVFGLDPGKQSDEDAPSPEELGSLFMTAHVQPAYKFNPDSAFAAVYGRAKGHDKDLTWLELPALVAAEAFRDQLAHYDLDELYIPHDEIANPKIGELRTNVAALVKDEPLLHRRGILVYSASVGRFKLDDDVQEQLEDTWCVHWQGQAKRTEQDAKNHAERIILAARQRALMGFSQALWDKLERVYSEDEDSALTPEERQDVIIIRLNNDLKRLANDPVYRLKLPKSMVQDLTATRQWTGLGPQYTPDDAPAPTSPPAPHIIGDEDDDGSTNGAGDWQWYNGDVGNGDGHHDDDDDDDDDGMVLSTNGGQP